MKRARAAEPIAARYQSPGAPPVEDGLPVPLLELLDELELLELDDELELPAPLELEDELELPELLDEDEPLELEPLDELLDDEPLDEELLELELLDELLLERFVVKLPALVAFPLYEFTTIFPAENVVLGASAVIWVDESTVKRVEGTPLK